VVANGAAAISILSPAGCGAGATGSLRGAVRPACRRIDHHDPAPTNTTTSNPDTTKRGRTS
jgi:hypothetical protein